MYYPINTIIHRETVVNTVVKKRCDSFFLGARAHRRRGNRSPGPGVHIAAEGNRTPDRMCAHRRRGNRSPGPGVWRRLHKLAHSHGTVLQGFGLRTGQNGYFRGVLSPEPPGYYAVAPAKGTIWPGFAAIVPSRIKKAQNCPIRCSDMHQ